MQYWDLSLDIITFICILKACGSSRGIEKGNKICNTQYRSGVFCISPLTTLILIPMEDLFNGKNKENKYPNIIEIKF